MVPILRASRIVLFAGFAAASAAVPVEAQDSTRADRITFLSGGSAEVWTSGEVAEFLAGFKAGWYRPGALGGELGLGVFPALLGEALILVPEVGPAVPFRIGEGLLVLRAGVSPLVVSGEGGQGAVLGGYAGAGIIVPVGPVGLRLDLNRRFLKGFSLWSVGIGFTAGVRFSVLGARR